jgi:hypothetical protein
LQRRNNALPAMSGLTGDVRCSRDMLNFLILMSRARFARSRRMAAANVPDGSRRTLDSVRALPDVLLTMRERRCADYSVISGSTSAWS